MKGNEQVIAALNDSLRNAHSAFMQFAKHALWLKEKGYGKLAGMEEAEAAKEKAYMDQLAYRLLFLEGDPDFGAMGETFFAAEHRAILEADLHQQKASAEALRHAVKTANDVQDYASRDLVNEILKAKEDRIDQIETELEQFDAMGREIYLSTKV
ncbi:ferritin-like domain-containing protein [Indioceanicola profundi]|uniref:ferritin-like domain-containing protein n=1 Tax=Indioceanicola profundi TaxID=2220096 RepID=UPI0013C454AD|nr:ferritin-like domain-containing protein [Indioceanicola profundi]